MSKANGYALRLADDGDGEAILQLLQRSEVTVNGVEMKQLDPHWLVAERDGAVVGAAQVLYGRPIGSVESIVVDPALSPHVRGRIVRLLLPAAFEILRRHGAQVVRGIVPFANKSLKRALKKRGMAVAQGGNIMLGRL